MSKIIYETEPCSRCGGCGEHSYCEAYGKTCFGCGGSGNAMSLNGKRAAKAVREFMNRYAKPADEIKAGDQFRPSPSEGWKVAITDACEGTARFLDRETDEWVSFISVKTKRAGYNFRPGKTVPIRPTVEQFNSEVVPFARKYKGATIIEKQKNAA